MTPYRQIRADYDRDTIVVYQAYGAAIAEAALAAGQFVPPFSCNRMTWIKPSFLWLMERSGWATKPGQERILAVRILRDHWEKALRQGVLTSFDPNVHLDSDTWEKDSRQAIVHVQWDPERSIHGAKLDHRSIQVGLSRQVIRQYATEWIREIVDVTPLARKICRLCDEGDRRRAKDLLPPEKVYNVGPEVAAGLGITR